MSVSARRADSAPFDLTEIIVRDEATARVITEAFVRDENNVSRQVWGGAAGGGGGSGGMTATAMPQQVSGAVYRSKPTPVTTNSTTVSVTGGIAPITYVWSDGYQLIPTHPNAATTAFSTVANPGDQFTEGFVCTVTDAAGRTATADVQAEARNDYEGGGSVGL